MRQLACPSRSSLAGYRHIKDSAGTVHQIQAADAQAEPRPEPGASLLGNYGDAFRNNGELALRHRYRGK